MLSRKLMTDNRTNAWSGSAWPESPLVPPRYRGVWKRSLLETPDLRDETTFVRWMQLGRWHADLRVPAAARIERAVLPLSECSQQQLALLMTQQGFCGVTQVTTGAGGEVCTWHRLVDYQPPESGPDAGVMVFETPDCIIETGIHGVYREIWRRLPHSTGRLIALAEPERLDGQASARLFIAGQYLMRVRPQCRTGPDFEISFGPIESERWHIQQSTLPELKGQRLTFSTCRCGPTTTQVHGDLGALEWNILEWEDA